MYIKIRKVQFIKIYFQHLIAQSWSFFLFWNTSCLNWFFIWRVANIWVSLGTDQLLQTSLYTKTASCSSPGHSTMSLKPQQSKSQPWEIGFFALIWQVIWRSGRETSLKNYKADLYGQHISLTDHRQYISVCLCCYTHSLSHFPPYPTENEGKFNRSIYSGTSSDNNDFQLLFSTLWSWWWFWRPLFRHNLKHSKSLQRITLNSFSLKHSPVLVLKYGAAWSHQLHFKDLA